MFTYHKKTKRGRKLETLFQIVVFIFQVICNDYCEVTKFYELKIGDNVSLSKFAPHRTTALILFLLFRASSCQAA